MIYAIFAVVGLTVASVGLSVEPVLVYVRNSRLDAAAGDDTKSAPPISEPSFSPIGAVPIFGIGRLHRQPEASTKSNGDLVPYWAQALFLEVLLGTVFALLTWKFSNETHLCVACVFCALLFEMAVIDLHHRLVLNLLSYPSAAIAFAGTTIWSGIGPGSSALGGVVALALFLVIELVGRGAMGRGDTKLATVIGLMRGYPVIWSALLFGIVTGGIMASGLLVSGRGRRSKFAYGPALAIGATISLFVGKS